MVIIDGKIVADDLLKSFFCCDLSRCKGACCVEGDMGAPLEEEEIQSIEANLDEIIPYLPEENARKIRKEGFTDSFKKLEGPGTRLMDDGACVFSYRDDKGYLQCGIEESYNRKGSAFRKPVSCHLYPIRIEKDAMTSFEMLVYDRWDICDPACKLGSRLQLPLFRFVKDALIRKYGEAFYQGLEHLYNEGK